MHSMNEVFSAVSYVGQLCCLFCLRGHYEIQLLILLSRFPFYGADTKEFLEIDSTDHDGSKEEEGSETLVLVLQQVSLMIT